MFCPWTTGIVHTKIQICWKFTPSQVIQVIDEFVLLSEQIWKLLALHQHCSPFYPLQRMGAVKTVASVPISIISLSPVKKSSCLNPERNTVCTDYKRKQSKTNMLVDFDLRGQQRMEFFTGGSVFMDYGLVCDHRDSFVNICPYWETKFCR